MGDEKPWHGEEGTLILLVAGGLVLIGALVYLVMAGAFSG